MKEFYSLTLPELGPGPVDSDLFKVLYGSSFKFDKEAPDPEEVHAI